ncbi:hypothetical protein [Fodinicola feengrottensis]|uniref:hypothetical protein n=1 Tax=Fodinicola feengrottensis TaxID=435914 RepID=UPI0031DE107A
MRTPRWALVAVAVVAVGILGGGAIATTAYATAPNSSHVEKGSKPKPPGAPLNANGVVTALKTVKGGQAVVLRTATGSATALLTPKTSIVTTAGKPATLAVGENVVVKGWQAKPGSLQAVVVVVR